MVFSNSFIKFRDLNIKALLRNIRKSDEQAENRKRYIFTFFILIGIIPMMVNLCRIGASAYQMFVYRQYHPHCLKFEISAKNGTEVAIVRQPEFFNFECWRPVDYPLIFGNLFGMFL